MFMTRSREEIQQEYDKIYGENPNKWNTPRRINFMINELKKLNFEPKTILDYGCGLGFALEQFGNWFPEADLYGIELSKVGADLSAERNPKARITSEDEFEDIKTFDLIACLGVAEHVEDLEPFFLDLKSRLNPNGLLYFEVPHNLVYSPGAHTYRRLTVGSRQIEWHFTRTRWETLLFGIGFNVVRRLKGEKASWEFVWILE
jgi:SAM-dependent methyltransferase